MERTYSKIQRLVGASDRLGVILTILLMALFLVSGIGKLGHPHAAALLLMQEVHVDLDLSRRIILSLASLEVLIAWGIAFGGRSRRLSLGVASATCFAFVVYHSLRALEGATGGCGCFGRLLPDLESPHLSGLVALSGGAASLELLRRSRTHRT